MQILRSRKTQFLFSSFLLDFSDFLMSGKHQLEERKTAIGPIHIVFLLGPTQTSFSFPLAGTPEATSWEQEQMARPHVKERTKSYTIGTQREVRTTNSDTSFSKSVSYTHLTLPTN